jgi:hypothetical protein
VHLKTVQLGIVGQDTAEIKSGVAEGDEVVIDGTDRLDEGTQVRVRKPGETEAINNSLARGARKKGGKKGDQKGAGSQK